MTNILDTIETRTITIAAGVHLNLVGAMSAGWGEHRTLTVNLAGDGASLECIFALIGDCDTAFPFDIVVNHQAVHTKSAVYIRSVLNGESSVHSEGRMCITSHAKSSDTYFSHHALLVSKGARAKIIPSLEIENDDVRAGHAVTVGRVDEDVLFYCAARGVDRQEATHLVTRGFLLADCTHIRDAEIRKLLEHKIDSAIHPTHAKP
ncbi:MAG: SufD family Fe-S cluster assembly protein [bacterium]|nr:SufD family Fe-S cluster assembly protein [bacterium]